MTNGPTEKKILIVEPSFYSDHPYKINPLNWVRENRTDFNAVMLHFIGSLDNASEAQHHFKVPFGRALRMMYAVH